MKKNKQEKENDAPKWGRYSKETRICATFCLYIHMNLIPQTGLFISPQILL